MKLVTVSHLNLNIGEKRELALVCGSPERAEKIANLLESPRVIQKNREYHSFSGLWERKEILVVSHGVGSAGAAICFNELIQLGAKQIIRVGTAGALLESMRVGDLVIPTAAVRLDGVSQQMIPLNFPATPDFELTQNLLKNLKDSSYSVKSGIIVTSDLFYPGLLDNQLEFYRKAGAIAVEMECSTLFICGYLKQVKTASVLGIDGNPLKWNEGNYDPKSSVLSNSLLNAAKVAFKTLVQENK